MASWREHLDISLRFRAQGLAEIEAGDLLQGSEKLWGAAAHAVKAAAAQRGWKHDGHAYLFRTVHRLVSDTGDSRLEDAFESCNRLHINFYENTMGPNEVRIRAQRASDFVDIVSAIVLSVS